MSDAKTIRTTVTLDTELLAAAQEYTGIQERGELIRTALRTLVQLEASRRLIALGGSDPDAEAPPRRRFS